MSTSNHSAYKIDDGALPAFAQQVTHFVGLCRSLRRLAAKTLASIACINPDNEVQVAETLAHGRDLSATCRARLKLEDQLIRPASDAARLRAGAVTEMDYLRDELACDALDADLTDLEWSVAGVRAAAAQALGSRLNVFVGSTLSRIERVERAIAALPPTHGAQLSYEARIDDSVNPRCALDDPEIE
jgi:hypothetical protein